MSSPAVNIYYRLYGTILNAVAAPWGAAGEGRGCKGGRVRVEVRWQRRLRERTDGRREEEAEQHQEPLSFQTEAA